jgi:cysteine-rich repeat protein
MASETLRRSMLLVALGALVAAAPAAACLADGAVAVSTNLSKAICEAAPKHVPNAACCSGEASPVWNVATSKCDTTCDSSDPCAYVTCTAQDQCHLAGVCNPATGTCSNPVKPNNSPCSDGNTCTPGDKCVSGACVVGPKLRNCCGNAAVEAGEQCDDGNQSALEDGCKANCTLYAGWVCSGSPSECCVGANQVRFDLPGLNQNQCESIKGSPDPGCCQGSHKGVWTGVKCNVVCSVNKCDPAEGYGTPADYGCDDIPCQTTSVCDPNTGCTHSNKAAGLACGSSTNDACTSPDSCNGAGACNPNHKVAGTVCSNGMPCNYAQCDGGGTCADASNVLNGQACNDGDACTLSDTCQAGQCAPGTAVVCQPFDGCHLAGTCDPQSGFCSAPPAPPGTACGSTAPLDVQCDLPDSCDGTGSCLSNSFPDNLPCGAPTGTCFSEKSCADGTCAAGPVQLAIDTPCGDTGPATACDLPDSCDDLGVCLPNHVSDGTSCGGGTTCTTAGSCAAGACEGASNKPAGTACGDTDPLGDCDAGDTCDDAGHCQTNLLDDTHVCRSSAGVCDVEESCDGAAPGCPDDAFEAAGTPCGALDACTPDQCDDAGICQSTHVDCPTTTTTTTTTVIDDGSTTTTTVVDGATTTTTTLAPSDPCAAVADLAHARCLIDVALAHDLCQGETMPAKLDRALRARLTKVGARLDAAIASEGRKRTRLLKKVRGAIAAVGRKATTARDAKTATKRISPSCATGLGGLVSAVQADLS